MRGYEFLVGGRGYGKNAALQRLREQHAAARQAYPPVPQTQVIGNLNVRWACPKPTDPVPPHLIPGTYGWYYDQARMIHLGQKTYAEVLAEFEAAH